MIPTLIAALTVALQPVNVTTPSPYACVGQRTFDTRGWRLTLAGEPEPKTGPSELAYRVGQIWRVVKLGTVPGTTGAKFEPLSASATELDPDDGSVVFVASWPGNPDQAHQIGRGIYRLRGERLETIVDAFTPVPGQGFRFNALGIPDFERGSIALERDAIAFWGGRDGGQWSGVYLWRAGELFTVADQAGPVTPWSAPDLRGARVGFWGTDQRGPAAFVANIASHQVTRLLGQGDALPAGDLIAHGFEVKLGEQIAAFGVGYGGSTRRILGWHQGSAWVIADPSWFKGPQGEQLYLDPTPVIDGDAVAFQVAVGQHSQVWVADGCALVRVTLSGDRIGSKQVRNYPTLDREAFSGGVLMLLANFTDGSQGYVRAVAPATPRR